MAAAMPDTPATLLSRLKEPGSGVRWNDDWKHFIRDYNRAVRIVVCGELKKILNVSILKDEMIEEVESRVWSSIAEMQIGGRPYDREVAKFRTVLRRIVHRRIVDLIRRSQHLFKEQSIDLPEAGADPEGLSIAEKAADPVAEREQEQAYREALLKSLIEEVRKRVSPEQMAIFEMVKLNGESPAEVAEQFGKNRSAIDKTVSRVMELLRELARRPEYQEEIL